LGVGIYYWNGSSWVTPTTTPYTGSTSITLSGNSFQRAALTGDVTAAANSNATTIANDAVTSAKILDGTIATADLADGAVTSAKIADGTIATADIANNAVTIAKLPAGGGTATTYLNGGGTWTTPPNNTYTGSTSITLNGSSFERAALTGDVTAAANSNSTTIAAGSVTFAKTTITTYRIALRPTLADTPGSSAQFALPAGCSAGNTWLAIEADGELLGTITGLNLKVWRLDSWNGQSGDAAHYFCFK